MKTAIFVGRFQPFHDGHRKCIEKTLEDCNRCIVLVRDTNKTEKNPFDYEKRKALIRSAFPNEDEVTIQRIEDPNCDLSVYIGRDVGYELIQLDETTEAISATNIRKKLYEESNPNPNPHPNPIIWLTGNSGAGKTTLAYGIRDHFKESAPVLVLDGDEMRSTISIDEGFSDEDRIKHNARVARLAKLMSEHGFLVIVAVIAPFDDARHMVSKICNPKWIYLKRSGLESEDRPYEPPTDPDLTVDNDVLSIDEARSTLISYLRGLEIGVRKPKSMPVKHKDSLIKR